MRFWLNQPLRDEAGDGSGGGGGGTPPITLDAIGKLINDTLNGYDKKLQAKLSKIGQPTPKADDGDGDGGEPPPAPKPGGTVDPEVTKLRKNQERLQKEIADERAERAKEREAIKVEKLDAALRRELSKYNFVDDDAFDAAYSAILRNVKYNDEGQLVGGADDLSLPKYVDARMKKFDTLLQPKPVAGGGVANGGKPTAGDDIDIDSIKPGMAAADIAKVRARLASIYQNK